MRNDGTKLVICATAAQDTECPSCARMISPGDRIARSDSGEWIHLACLYLLMQAVRTAADSSRPQR
jgi:hypothetical protein